MYLFVRQCKEIQNGEKTNWVLLSVTTVSLKIYVNSTLLLESKKHSCVLSGLYDGRNE